MAKFMFKVILMGDAGTGKSALINAYIQGTYKKNYVSGLKIEFYIKNEVVSDGSLVKLQVDDSITSSLNYNFKERFLGYHLSNTSLVILCYDLNNAQTLHNCIDWIHVIRNFNQTTNICLVGCKSDLPLKVDLEFAGKLTKKYKLEFHETTSAKELKNVSQLFHICAEWCYKHAKNR
jgi:GTPase SAR1 family protein